MANPLFIFLTGKPACGKDTQAQILAKKIKGQIVVTSKEIDNFFKKNKDKYIFIGKMKINLEKQRKIKNQGKLVSFRLVEYIIRNLILKAVQRKKTLIFAGSPRSLFEAKSYLKIFKKNPHIKFAFIYLKISDQTAIERALKRKRADDQLKALKTRFKSFKKDILPMLKWLQKNKVLIEINGENSPQKVSQNILKKLAELK